MRARHWRHADVPPLSLGQRVNFHKCQMVAKALGEVGHFQRAPYVWQPCEWEQERKVVHEEQ